METIPYGAGGTIDGFRHWRCIASRIELTSIQALLACFEVSAYLPSVFPGWPSGPELHVGSLLIQWHTVEACTLPCSPTLDVDGIAVWSNLFKPGVQSS